MLAAQTDASARATAARPIEMRTASAVVADDIRTQILQGTLAGNTRVLQDEVATRMGVSQMIVREAFKQLVSEGFLRSEPRRGVSVSELSYEDASELAQLRSAIEVQALEAAIPKLSKEDLADAELILNQLETAQSSEDVLRLNALFHDRLYAASRRERTTGLITMLRLSFDRYFRFVRDETGHFPKSQKEHRKLLKLCREGRVPEATALLRAHILGTAQALAQKFTASD